MAYTAEDILVECYEQLQDSRMRARWPVEELVGYLNTGVTTLVSVKPESSAVSHLFSLVAGTRQVLPTDATCLLDIQYNEQLSIPGLAIREVSRDNLDGGDPSWHTAPSSPTVHEYAYDQLREPKVFWVSPPAEAGVTIRGTYAAIPAPIDPYSVDLDSPTSTPLPVDDSYFPALVHYVLWRAYDKEDEYASNEVRAVKHGKQFFTLLGEYSKARALYGPEEHKGKKGANE